MRRGGGKLNIETFYVLQVVLNFVTFTKQFFKGLIILKICVIVCQIAKRETEMFSTNKVNKLVIVFPSMNARNTWDRK